MAGKRLHYLVPVTAGVPVIFTTSTSPSSLTTALDTAISVFDATGATLLGSDDDAYPRLSTDSALVYRPASTASVCVRVEDYFSWAGQTPSARSPNQFTLNAGTAVANQAVLDHEPNDTGSGQALGALSATGLVLAGGLDTASDVDVYTFDVPNTFSRANISLPPVGAPSGAGRNGFGSTLPRFTATIQTVGGLTLGELAPPPGAVDSMPVQLLVPVWAAGTFRLVVSRPSGFTASTNDFYSTTVSVSADYRAEAESSGGVNDTRAGAEALTLTASTTTPRLSSTRWMGSLPPGDVADYFKFTATSGSSTELTCRSARQGSGLGGFTAALFGSSTTALQSEIETAVADIVWSSTDPAASRPAVVLGATGTFYVRLTATSVSATNVGTYYRCDLWVTAP